jgi:hypothetical protein
MWPNWVVSQQIPQVLVLVLVISVLWLVLFLLLPFPLLVVLPSLWLWPELRHPQLHHQLVYHEPFLIVVFFPLVPLVV